MEYLSRKLKQEARTNKNFSYHKNCRKNEINHLCFADDLLIFCSGAEDSIAVVNQCLKEFANLSGISKSQIDYGDLSDAAKLNISNLIGFNSMKVKCQ